MTIRNSTDLKNNITSQLADNTSGDISAADVRNNLTDIVDSITTVVGETTLSVVKQTSDVTNNSNTTPSDVTGLAFALTSGRRYYFRFVMQGQSAATTTGLGFTFSGPTMTFAHIRIQNQQGSAGTDQYYTNSTANITTVLVNASVVAANIDYMFFVEGICQPSEDGILQLRCRSEINASQITVKNGLGFLMGII